MRAKRSIINLIIGMISQVVLIVLGMIVTKYILVSFGSEVNGMIASIGQILIYLSLLEAGVGTATLQALYKPIATSNKKEINSIMSATSIYYKKIGLFYFIAVVLLSFIYPLIIDTEFNYITIMMVVLLTGIGGVVNFYFQGKYKIFLMAEGKIYVETTILTVGNILISFYKILLITLGFNIIIIQAGHLIFITLQAILFKLYIDKNYKWIDLSQSPNFKSLNQRNSALTHQISSLIFNNTDIIFLTIFTNLKVVSVYYIYSLVFNVIDKVVQTFNKSFTFILGQKFHGDKRKFLEIYNVYELYFMAFIFSFSSVILLLTSPFLKLYTLGVNDIDYVDFWLPLLFISIKLLTNARSTSNAVINIAGHFKQTQKRSIYESLINIVFSLFLIQIFGIYGVLLGTIAALIYRSTDIVIYANRKILNQSPWKTFKRWMLNIVILLIIMYASKYINLSPDSYIELVFYSLIMFIIIFIIYFLISSLSEPKAYTLLKAFFYTFISNYSRKKRK